MNVARRIMGGSCALDEDFDLALGLQLVDERLALLFPDLLFQEYSRICSFTSSKPTSRAGLVAATLTRWKPNGVSMMPLTCPTFVVKTASSNAGTICPRETKPRSPPFGAEPGSWEDCLRQRREVGALLDLRLDAFELGARLGAGGGVGVLFDADQDVAGAHGRLFAEPRLVAVIEGTHFGVGRGHEAFVFFLEHRVDGDGLGGILPEAVFGHAALLHHVLEGLLAGELSLISDSRLSTSHGGAVIFRALASWTRRR